MICNLKMYSISKYEKHIFIMVSGKYLPLTSRGGSTPIPQGKCGYLQVGVKMCDER